MALRFVGKDPELDHNGSPTIYEDGDTYILQGWVIEDPLTLAEIHEFQPIPDGEAVIRFPKRMMPLFPEVYCAADDERRQRGDGDA
ncbi:hypothetical protein [Rhizohabitans arisaemae]|uniref:hypothetical protein n=1 Tax=Rhizohabitans arisaemae TaxID=2720610 RepID=UPI0024B0A746|nr:hypothetical protein [Rhizohabitans arisaemae]